MELRQLTFFVAVADEVHFGRAAQRLHLAQPSVSQHIRRLERELGVLLLERNGRGVRLTPAGVAFYEEARFTLERADKAANVARQAARGETGLIPIGYFPPVCNAVLPTLVRGLRESWPHLTAYLRALDPIPLETSLRQGEVAVAFSDFPVEGPAIATMPVSKQPLVVSLPREHPLALSPSIWPVQLSEATLIISRPGWAPHLHSVITSIFELAGHLPRVIHEVDSTASWLLAVASGLGVTILPAAFAQHGGDQVVCRPLEACDTFIEIGVHWRHSARTPQVDALLRVIE